MRDSLNKINDTDMKTLNTELANEQNTEMIEELRTWKEVELMVNPGKKWEVYYTYRKAISIYWTIQ